MAYSEEKIDQFFVKLEPVLPDIAFLIPILKTELKTKLREQGKLLSKTPDHWTTSQRTQANLRAMKVATKDIEEMTSADKAALLQYSGWGGLSIEKVAGKFPEGFPVPEKRGLIHEYYTPTRVVDEVARVIKPLIQSLPTSDTGILTLEPSAGIGRFIHATREAGFINKLDWRVVEYSALSAKMLQAMDPSLEVYQGPFERWITEQGPEYAGRIGLVLANPPYGARGAAVTADPDRRYREKNAYAYFLRRGLDMLGPNGLGVYLIPSGFLTGRGEDLKRLRENVLTRHHLSAAYRLPSKLFPGAMLVTDLLFFRSRGGELAEVYGDDEFILEGAYFDEYPQHILGTERGKVGSDVDQTKIPRWGYQVEGTFDKLPDLIERPICTECQIVRPVKPFKKTATVKIKSSGGTSVEVRTELEDAPSHVTAASKLGARVSRYLADASIAKDSSYIQLWPELIEAVQSWSNQYGNPWEDKALQLLAKEESNLQRFLQAHKRTGEIIDALLVEPIWEPRYKGKKGDILARAEWEFKQNEDECTVSRLGFQEDLQELYQAGWYLDGHNFDRLVPASYYLTGSLWPKYDRVEKGLREHTEGPLHDRLRVQKKDLLTTINPVVFEDLGDLSPRQHWLPLRLISEWVTTIYDSLKLSHISSYKWRGSEKTITLEKVDGLITIEGCSYEDLPDKMGAREVVWILGWLNHDKTYYRPRKLNMDESSDEARLRWSGEWDRKFQQWVVIDDERKEQIERAYARQFQGFVPPTYSGEPLPIARWVAEGIKLDPHQAAGARRVIANRGGLIAFDVGVGKTFTGLAAIAKARQEGWCRRPVILVPSSIVWKWEKDVKTVLPDYRTCVIGSKRWVSSRGKNKGKLDSKTDTPEERGQKWTRFQAGEYDVVILSYDALECTPLSEHELRLAAEKTEAIQRIVALLRRNLQKKKKKLTEREEAVLTEGVAAWVAEKTEIREKRRYDPGILWDDIGIDLLMVDESQNFKNLYLPEQREGGVPKYMGSSGPGSKLAWQLNFRSAAVRRKNDGRGIILLSATPAKNSPLEFYNAIHYIDHKAWERRGITNPEQFIDRYLKIELKYCLSVEMQIALRSAVVGFKNLHELRDVIFRYGEFKTAEEADLRLPETEVNLIEVDMDDLQESKYDMYVGQIQEEIRKRHADKEKGKILKLLGKLSLVSVHANLDEQYDWKTAAVAEVEPTSPKFAAMAEKVAKMQHCGHIVFVDNVAAHRWILQTLLKEGIPEKRVAILNAETAKSTAKRQRIAEEFCGDLENDVLPKYDVVVANKIAYEGIDLQKRTCAIHHLDLPWEPATLQQRNGRGVRQGNTERVIEINYYFSTSSQDGIRFDMIKGKQNWMKTVLESFDRDTNNPGAQQELGPEETLLLISRDKEKTKALIASIAAKREMEAKEKELSFASKLLKQLQARFRKAEKEQDNLKRKQLLIQGEELLKELGQVDSAIWPWAPQAKEARKYKVLLSEKGEPPLREGQFIRQITKLIGEEEEIEKYYETGRLSESQHEIGIRSHGSVRWVMPERGSLVEVTPDDLNISWPVEDLEAVLHSKLDRWGSRNYWSSLGRKPFHWSLASDRFLEEVWSVYGSTLIKKVSEAPWYDTEQYVPVLVDGTLEIAFRGRVAEDGVQTIPPTERGFAIFLDAAAKSDIKLGHPDLSAYPRIPSLSNAAEYWWWGTRKIPRGYRKERDERLEERTDNPAYRLDPTKVARLSWFIYDAPRSKENTAYAILLAMEIVAEVAAVDDAYEDLQLRLERYIRSPAPTIKKAQLLLIESERLLQARTLV